MFLKSICLFKQTIININKFYIKKNVIKYIYIKPQFKKIKNTYYLTTEHIINDRIYKYKKYHLQHEFYYSYTKLTYISSLKAYCIMIDMVFNENGALIELYKSRLYNILSYTSDLVEVYFNSLKVISLN